MAVTPRTNSGVSASGTTHTINFPASMVAGEIILMWVVCQTGKTFNTPSGWTLEYQADSGGAQGVNAALFSRAWVSGTTVSVTTSSATDVGYVTVTWNSNAVSGVTLGFGQQTYTGTGTDPSDAGDTYTYSSRGKGDVDTTGDNVLGVFAGGILCPTDIPVYFYALKSATVSAAPALGGDDTSIATGTLPTTATIRYGAIRSTYREPVGRGFTLTNTPTSVAFGTWISENADTSGGGGPGGNGTQNNAPVNIAYTARNSMPDSDGWPYDPNDVYVDFDQNENAHNSLGEDGVPSRGQGRGAIYQGGRDAIQPEQGSSIAVV